MANKFLNKFTRHFYERKNLMPDSNGDIKPDIQTERELSKNIELLQNCALMYASLSNIRMKKKRNNDYFYGRQFEELIPDPDNCGLMISEYNYLVRQGFTPLSINIILPRIKAIVGVYRNESMEPLAISRVREEQKLGELLTATLQYAYNAKCLHETYTQGYKEFNISAIPCFRTGWRWDKMRKINEVYAELVDINDMFWDFNYNDSYFENIHTIGCLHDWTLSEILTEFATLPEDTDKIIAAYKDVQWEYPETHQQFSETDKNCIKNFYESNTRGRYRVIEIWTEEAHGVYPCWDTATGEIYTLPATIESRQYIDAENNQRISEIVNAGGSAGDAALIEVGQNGKMYRVDTDWVVRYMTPNGYVLKIEVAPYIHGSHPFVIGAFPLINGEVHSVVSDLINSQRMINRLTTSSEYYRMNKSKGFTVVNKNVLDRSGVSVDQVSKEWSSPRGMIALDIREGDGEVFKVYTETGSSPEESSKLQFYMDIANEVSGAHGALRGEKPNSGTPASLYAQETQNANNNMADGYEWYNSLIQQVNYKLMMLQLQYYDKRRFIEIAGSEYTKEIDYILKTPARQRNTLFDLQLIKSPSNGFARAQREQMLQQLYESGAIPAKIWLDNTTVNGADKIAEELDKYNQEQAQAQQAMSGMPTQLPPQ